MADDTTDIAALDDSDTKKRILIAATRLFADRGLDAATLREITEAASANIAAVNYYFGSRQQLIRRTLHYWLAPINAGRLEALEACEAAAGGQAVPLEAIIEALVRPMVELSHDGFGGRAPVRLLLQMRAIPKSYTNQIAAEEFDEAHRRFAAALQRTLAEADPARIALGYEFVRGATLQVLSEIDPAARHVPTLENLVDIDDEAIIDHLIRFAVAGFRALAT